MSCVLNIMDSILTRNNRSLIFDRNRIYARDWSKNYMVVRAVSTFLWNRLNGIGSILTSVAED